MSISTTTVSWPTTNGVLESRVKAGLWAKFLEDTSDTLTVNYTVGSLNHTWTGTGGATAYWADWRSNNTSLDGSNGTDDENDWHETWQDFLNENFYVNGVKRTKAEEIAWCIAKRDAVSVAPDD